MSLPLLAALAVPLFLAPWDTHRWMAQVYGREKAVVAVDNGAIRLGRESRVSLESARIGFRSLAPLEAAHDLAHACARLPSPAAAECLVQDLALEKELETGFSLIDAQASGRWSAARGRALSEGAALGEALGIGRDPIHPPWERRSCPVCGLRFRVSWKAPPSPVVWGAEGARTGVHWRGGGSQSWTYLLDWGDGNDGEGEGSGAL